MAPLFKLFRELDPSDVHQAVKVRVVRCYCLHVGEDTSNVYSLECVLHDAEGARIHLSVKRLLLSRFINLLHEGRLYAIKNFVLINNTMRLKTSISTYKMILIPKTHIVEVFDSDFPRNIFNFKMYDDLSLWENADENLLIDVIGSLSSRSERQTREVQGRETTMLDITLKNLQGSMIQCTLWGNYAEQLLDYLGRNDGPVVVIMQLCRMRKFRGEIQLANTYKVSKIIWSGNVEEIADFNRGLVLEGNFEIPVVNEVMPTNGTLQEELELSRDRILSVDRLIRVQQVEQYWILCKIVAVEPMLDWCYVSFSVIRFFLFSDLIFP